MKIFLYLIAIIIPTVLVILGDLFIFKKDLKAKGIVKTIFKDFFLINLTTPMLNALMFMQTSVLNPKAQSNLYFLLYFVVALSVGAIYLGLKFGILKYFELEKVELKHKKTVIFLYIMSIVFCFLGVLAFSATVWGKENFGNAKPDEILITLLSPTTGTDPKIILGFIEGPLLISISLAYLFAFIFYKRLTYKLVKKDEVKFKITEFASRITFIVLSSCILVSGIFYGAWKFELKTLIYSYFVESNYIEENYVSPENIKMTFPEQKRNLIHIYLESVENSYFDKANGGFMKENLMPNLLEVTNENVLNKTGFNFSHKAKGEGYGGPKVTYGATWSVASMVNQAFGFPMKVPVKRNAYGTKGSFIPGAVGLGDILEKAGYEQTVMFGADADFGGLTYMFEDHGNFKIMDHQYALKNNMLPTPDYRVNWGYEDEKLYKFAKDEITRLAQTGKPFHFMMENADTHVPGFAFKEDGTPIYDKNAKNLDYGRTVKFSDEMFVPFLKWIMEQDFYENTTIIIIGDHLSMERKWFRKNHFNNYERTTYNLILNPAKSVDTKDESRYYNRIWGTYDMFPTIVSSLGIEYEGDRLGLGTDLFSKTPTLYERDGYKKVYDEYVCKSPYYNKNFLNSHKTYDGSNLIFK